MAVNVARIYEQTIRPGHSYCRICLRSGTETSLVAPKSLVQFTNSLKLNIFESKTARTACYYCEATATTALRLYQACVNAVSVKNVCKPLKTMKPNDPVPEWLRKAIIGCNANLKEYRQKSLLQQTEVLVVDSSGIEYQTDGTSQPTRINAPTLPQPPREPSETIVLDDDDEPPSSDAPPSSAVAKLVPIETNKEPVVAIVGNEMQILTRRDDNNFVMHPLVMQNNRIVAPTLVGHVKDGQLVIQPQTQTRMIQSEIAVVQPESTVTASNQNKALQNKRKRFYGENDNDRDSRLKRILETDKVARTNSADGVKKCTTNNDLKSVNSLISNTNDNDPIAIITNVMTTSDSNDGEFKEVVSRAPGPVEKTGRIDWEDKIPMDVISFVDASDPNLYIVPDTAPVNPPVFVDVQPKTVGAVEEAIIDLC